MCSNDVCSEDSCWICLAGAESGPLERPCRCPRSVHLSCLGRWQLQQAGRSEEQRCRFCTCVLPPLEDSLLPPHLAPVAAAVTPYMAVVYQGEHYKIPVRPGLEGMAEFRARVKCLFGLPHDSDFQVSFECAAPTSGEKLTLRGMGCFNAAASCAAISAAKRAAGEDGGFEWSEAQQQAQQAAQQAAQ
ncbi:hypothetical protein CHLRE_17g719100v5 [Chlamydomonas reinhardtii]|uniref:Zys1B protein n=2 Tax=Chlamydomonas reinhardtii TaxID=3055 RepID=Q39624_CHLRE|nr:uncharacterized protein CHLRE_17g719100v5 [Chlamydomonas reinhardtii]PNW70420.1 hypothetical protein CHLRE_17g719100v5 [Chlamydomonas reinhardtii]BAA77272.1 zys1B [Chlamydomonas reinhardtii]CAA53723.1 zys1B [Chlamydomonas reinhardtii]|eukprot:XP_001703779.1 zygote-specific protein [Chlamydomonas reinhardtii]